MFYLFANCNFVSGRYDDWQAAYDKLGEYVWANEYTTKTYYFGIPMDYADNFSESTSMLAFEVYGERDDLYKTHFSSPAMAEFLSKIPSTMTTGLDLAHYSLSSGFLDASSTSQECGIMHDWKIECNSPEARTTLLSKLEAITKSAEGLSGPNSSGDILTFMVFTSLDSDTGARIYARFKDRAALKRWETNEDVVHFWLGNKEEVKTLDGRMYVPNKKGWLHR